MHIELTRSGGFTGIPVRVSLDSTELSEQEQAELREALNGASFFDLPDKMEPQVQGADRFTYQLTIEEGEKRKTVRMAESEMPESLQPLIQRLVSRSRQQ